MSCVDKGDGVGHIDTSQNGTCKTDLAICRRHYCPTPALAKWVITKECGLNNGTRVEESSAIQSWDTPFSSIKVEGRSISTLLGSPARRLFYAHFGGNLGCSAKMAKTEIKTKEAKARAAMAGGKGKRKARIPRG